MADARDIADTQLVQTDLELGKQVLALDALSKLTKQFSQSPDFGELIHTLLLTLSGQFTTANAFAILRDPDSAGGEFSFYGTGKFKNSENLKNLDLEDEVGCHLWHGNRLLRVAELSEEGFSEEFSMTLAETRVMLVIQLIHNDKLLGLLGIGERVTKRPYSDGEIELLATVVNAITPFLGNSYLFWKIASLSNWHLSILNSVQQAVFVFDSGLRLKTANREAKSLLGEPGTMGDSSGESEMLRLDEVFPPASFRDWSSKLMRIAESDQDMVFENMVAGEKDRQKVYNVKVSHILSGEHSRSDLIITLDDVTEQKENELRLFELQKFADKGVMASSIAHELNNFLALLLGGIEMTEIAVSRNDEEKTEIHLSKLKGNIEKMERFTAGLMDYTNVETQRREVDLNSIINDVLSFVTVQKRFQSIELAADLEDDLPAMDVDPDQIAQLLLNFLNNAADAILEAERTDGRIEVSTATEDGGLVLRITDNGCGIPDDVKDKLFKHRLTTKETGHGYGLVTCAKIIENHQAGISAESVVGEGTMFVLTFPL